MTSGHATLSADGSFTDRPDVAIVVFGENPYAEFVGDRRSVEYSPADDSDLQLLRRLRAQGIPVVSVFLSGRPLWVNPEINASDAFVAAFLPGSEGGGVVQLRVSGLQLEMQAMLLEQGIARTPAVVAHLPDARLVPYAPHQWKRGL